MPEFVREGRYVVLKLKDLETLPQQAYEALQNVISQIEPLLIERQYVVVESDWPEYEVVWKMIKDRVTKNAGSS